jgi:hypothetical protein
MDSIELLSKCFRQDELLLFKYVALTYSVPPMAILVFFGITFLAGN